MKIMVASDIHGSSLWCRRVLDKFEQTGADRLLLLGDLLYHGPRNDLPEEYRPKEVIAMLNSYREKILVVRGNCEAEVDSMVLDFPVGADYIYLVSGDLVVFATHGHIYSPDKLPPFLSKGSLFLSGHTHVAYDREEDGIRFMNPGSPSIPKEGTPPSYIIIENGNASLYAF